MFKKSAICLTCILLMACQSPASKEHQQTSTEQTNAQQESLVLKSLFYGDANEQGMYHFSYRNIGDQSYQNIYYYDYATKKEIFLCDKPECSHMDDSCTSFVDVGFRGYLFLHGEKLYLVKNETGGMIVNSDGSITRTTKAGPQIISMDLDGKNRKDLCTLPDGFTFEDDQVIMDERFLYLVLTKENIVEIDNGSSMSYTEESRLYRIDFTNGDQKDLLDMKNKNLIGVHDRKMLLSSYHYQEDPDQLLQKKDFEKYDEIMYNATSTYTSYDIDKKTFSDEIPIDVGMSCVSYGDDLYYEKDKEIHRVSLSNGENEVMITLPKDMNYGLLEVRDGNLIIPGSATATYVKSFVLSLQDASMKEITLSKKQPKEPVQILAETKDAFFVYYDHDQHLEKTWAGTDQYELDKAWYGLISKEDYWKDRSHYETFETISTQ